MENDNGTFRFLHLPVELRLIVYENLPISTVRATHRQQFEYNMPPHPSHLTLIRKVLATCRRVHNEAKAFLMAKLEHIYSFAPTQVINHPNVMGKISAIGVSQKYPDEDITLAIDSWAIFRRQPSQSLKSDMQSFDEWMNQPVDEHSRHDYNCDSIAPCLFAKLKDRSLPRNNIEPLTAFIKQAGIALSKTYAPREHSDTLSKAQISLVIYHRDASTFTRLQEPTSFVMTPQWQRGRRDAGPISAFYQLPPRGGPAETVVRYVNREQLKWDHEHLRVPDWCWEEE